MTIFLGGAVVYYQQYRLPEDGMEVYVVGKQWMWKLQHETGQREINELHIPVGRKVKLTMTTEDVIHNFAVPDFRTKMDVVPGRYTYVWFEATKPGKYRIQCMEYCGLNHSGMGGWVYVMEQRDFDNWLSGSNSNQTPVEAGRDLFEAKLGCNSCHQQASGGRGPALAGVFGTDQKLTNGQTVRADEEYIRNSILNPQGQIVEGYQPIMPTFKGQVTEEQLNSLVAYIKSLSGSGGSGGSGSAATGGGTSTDGAATPAKTQSMRNSGLGGDPNATNMVAPTADRGQTTRQGSNPNAPPDTNPGPRSGREQR
jgi:cytochrome c oxidase subunit 2